jgi:hypothetical protein
MSDLVRSGSQTLANINEPEDRRISRIRIWLRKQFEEEQNVREILLASFPAQAAKQHLIDYLGEQIQEKLWNQEFFHQILDELLAELEEQRSAEPSLYLVDANTGKSIMRLREEAIYQPPDYIGEDGIQRRAKPVLHPGISVPLTMRAHNEGRLAKASANPNSASALLAIREPNSIIEAAIPHLQQMGYEVGPLDSGEPEEVEVGREFYDPLQSQNVMFHRHAAFGAILARRIAERMGEAKKCDILRAVSEKNSKQRWVRVTFTRA